LTLIGITFIRQTHGLHGFGMHTNEATYIIITLIILSLQIFFGYIGYKVMKANSYFDDYLNGKEKNP